jgi:hypothetical protein
MTIKRAIYQYIIHEEGVPRHIWSVDGAAGGIHLFIWPMDIEAIGYIGGIEVHWRTQPSWSNSSEPDHERCWLLDGPCWHDGSSLEATDYWIPLWLSIRGQSNEHQIMFDHLRGEYAERFESMENDQR